MAPMPTFAAEPDGSASDIELAYYRRRAEGGVAAVVTAGCSVAEAGLAFRGQWRCDDDRCLPSLERAAKAIHTGGAKAVLQLAHAGSIGDFTGRGTVESVVQAFSRAAARAKTAGFDGVEIHGGHRELLQQFLSPATNPVNPEDREQVPLQVVAGVQRSGPSSVWYRVDPSEPEQGGLRLDDVARLAARLDVDVLDLSAKRYSTPGWGAESQRPVVMAVGGIETPRQAESALEEGCGLVALGHLLLSCPDWPRLVQDGLWRPQAAPPDVAALRAALTPKPVIDYLVKKGRALA